MAKEYEVCMNAHPSIYKAKERELKIYFCEPEHGINSDTGILLLIAGFGGHANSKVYKKMRRQFADSYNLMTVQCDYFGWEFMQDSNKVRININRSDLEPIFSRGEIDEIFSEGTMNLNKLVLLGSKHSITLRCMAEIDEDLTDFNDMGIMQAVDNITAVLAVITILKDNQVNFNQGKILIYGHSHGAYLSYLCNAFAPGLFSLIIDNSAWLFPAYLQACRILNYHVGSAAVIIFFDYLARKIVNDGEILFLPSLYPGFPPTHNEVGGVTLKHL